VTVYYGLVGAGGNVEDEDSVTVTIQPTEPECKDGEEHDWQSPHEIVGGIKGNPGVWGRGGGVIVDEACMRCGCRRQTDTWAQRPDTGEQGLQSVAYAEEHYAAEVAAMNAKETKWRR